MAALPPLAPITFIWIEKDGRPRQAFGTYLVTVDQMLRGYFHDTMGLTNAANDAAAAAAGVQINQFYHNAGAVRIRLT